MKKQILTLITCIAVCLSSPAFAMNESKEDTILKCQSYKIPKYETSIECTYCDPKGFNFATIDFKIKNSDKEEIGEILLQYYPKNIIFYNTSLAPVVRLRHIEINEQHQRKYHGTRAMETMIVALRKSSSLPEDVELWLEYSSWTPHLEKFYTSFGFKATDEPSALETKIMKVKLNETKFPYFAKNKTK